MILGDNVSFYQQSFLFVDADGHMNNHADTLAYLYSKLSSASSSRVDKNGLTPLADSITRLKVQLPILLCL